MAPDRGRKAQPEDDLIDWFTVSYRTIYTGVGVLLAVLIGGGYYMFVVRQPARPTAPPDLPMVGVTATFVSIEGSVKVKPTGKLEWVNADSRMVLKKSDLVRTGPGAVVELRFANGNELHIRPDSLIAIDESAEDPTTRQRRSVYRIESGVVNFSNQNSAEFVTPTVTGTAASDSAGAINVAQEGDTGIKLYKGTAQLATAGGQSVALGSNEQIQVSAKGTAGVIQQLPSPPTILAPPHLADIAYPDPDRATTLLQWSPVAGAATYHLVLDVTAAFTRPLLDQRGIKDNSQQLRGLDVGRYFWRVSAVDKAGIEGNFSDFARFSVMQGTASSGGPPPALVIEALDVRTNILQVKGRTEPGARVTVDGQRVDVQADGSFNEFITLEKSGRQTVVIRATSINGGVVEQKRSVVVAN
jgi:hypothetical protein